jgi:putative membrane protein (TIGR04086 family)
MIRNVSQTAKAPIKESLNLILILKGILVSYIITVPAFMLFALILANMDFPERLISPVVVITTIISVLTAGSTATRGLKSKGWLSGCIVGFVYMLILYLLSSIIYDNFSVDHYVVTMTIIGVLTGAIGGIIGINFKKNVHVKHYKAG